MGRRSFKYIVVLLSCTLALVLALQVLWLVKLTRSSQAEHERAFKEALNNTSDELQRLENLSMIEKDLPVPKKNKKIVRKTISSNKRGAKKDTAFASLRVSQGGQRQQAVLISKTDTAYTSLRVSQGSQRQQAVMISTKDTAYTSLRVTQDGGQQQTTVISKVEKSAPRDHSQAYASVMVSSSVTKVSTGPDAIKARAQGIDAKVQNIDTLLKVMVLDFERKDINARERLRPYQLIPVLNRELKQKGLDTTYRFAVFKVSDTIMPLMFSDGYQKNVPHYTAALFRQDVFREKSFLAAYPLDANAYVWKDLRSALILSGCFSLIIIGLFAFTFRAILTQGKLARIKNDFINNMSHEFKTPIATISLASDALKKEVVRADRRQSDYYTGIIKDENKKLRRHLDRILELSVLETQAMGMQPVKTNLVELIQETVSDFKLILEQSGGHIRVLAGNSTIDADIDPFYFKHAIHNLIDNAIKYCDRVPEIGISVEESGASVVISIRDNGIGMSSETRALAFEKFYRAHTGNLHAVKGFGLGLNYTQHIIRQHQGHISLQSEPGKGTLITIQLPAYGKA